MDASPLNFKVCKHGLPPKSCPHCWLDRERLRPKSYVLLKEKINADYDLSIKSPCRGRDC